MLCVQGRVYAPGEAKDEMAQAIKEFNDFVIKDDRVEVVALPFRDGVNIVQRRYSLALPVQLHSLEADLQVIITCMQGIVA